MTDLHYNGKAIALRSASLELSDFLTTYDVPLVDKLTSTIGRIPAASAKYAACEPVLSLSERSDTFGERIQAVVSRSRARG